MKFLHELTIFLQYIIQNVHYSIECWYLKTEKYVRRKSWKIILNKFIYILKIICETNIKTIDF